MTDPARGQQRQKPLRQQVGGQRIDREAHIKTVRCDGGGDFEDPGIVDQHIEMGIPLGDRLRESGDVGHVRQVGQVVFCLPGPRQGGEILLHLLQLGRVAPVQQDIVPLCGQSPGGFQPDAVGRPG